MKAALHEVEDRIRALKDELEGGEETPVTLGAKVQGLSGEIMGPLLDRLDAVSQDDRQGLAAIAGDAVIMGQRGIDVDAYRLILKYMPLWAVTTLAAGSRIPLEAGLFDYVVFDEAGVTDIASALPLLFRAKAAVIVGDPMQLGMISNLDPREERLMLSRNDLLQPGIGRFVQGQTDLFQLAASAIQGAPFLLNEHYRCHPDIAAYFNEAFYGRRLTALTDTGKLRVPKGFKPGLHWTDVQGSVSTGRDIGMGGSADSDAEAEAVVDMLNALVALGFEGTVGVVTFFAPQAKRINERASGQGFAEVRISSLEFDRLRQSPVTLDWAEMEETEQTRDEILMALAEQCRTALAWPDTAVTPGNPFVWRNGNPRGGLVALLADYGTTPLLSHNRIDERVWQRLKELRQRFGQPYALSLQERISRSTFRALRSDGRLPEPMDYCHIPEDAGAELDRTLAKLERDLVALQRRFGRRIGREVLGDILGFATWCFWRCPTGIADVLLGAYDGEYSYDIHHTLLCEGVARVVSTTDQLRRYFKALERRLARGRRVTTADYGGLARVLGTSDKAARVLNQALADRIVEETVKAIQAENGKGYGRAYKARFKTALGMLAALLRHRQARPAFLDPDHDTAAGRLLAALDTAERRLGLAVRPERSEARSPSPLAAKRLRASADIIADLKDFIHRKGRNPNLIVHINAIEEE